MTVNTRAEGKARTRRRIIDAAFQMIGSGRSFSSISLREVAKQAGIAATSFYTHFESMEALGLVLIDEASVMLRQLMREGRLEEMRVDNLAAIQSSVSRFVRYLKEHEALFRFLLGEAVGGQPASRRRIQRDIQLCVLELAEEIEAVVQEQSRTPVNARLEAEILVTLLLGFGVEALNMPPERRELAANRLVEKLRLVIAGGRALAP